MNLLSSIIPTSFIRWVENLPEWFLLIAMGCTILLVLVIMWLVIRKLNATDSPKHKQNTPAKPPVTSAPRPAAPLVSKIPSQPVSIPVSKPQPTVPVQPATAPVTQPRQEEPVKEISVPPVKLAPAPIPVSKPLPTTPLPAVAVPEPLLESPTKPASQQPPVLDLVIYKKIAALNGVNKTVLFAGAGLEYLPVTIPVQTAVKLAGSGKKILLIDLDIKRNAIAKVFDPDETTVKACTRPKPLPTSVANLSFWPADFFARFGQINLRTLIQSASAQFDLLLINAPFLDGHPDRKLIASSAKYALIFCKTKPQFERLQTLIAAGECQLLESKPIEC